MVAVLSVGSEFAGYRIERHLGSGGMGSVYLARNPDLPRSEALKVLSTEFSNDRQFRARFIQEADVAAGLDHPNIVSVYQRGQFEGQLWIAMQFVDGVNADDAMFAGQMPAARAVYVIGEVAKALDYAHQRGVVHRDVKPANFLLAGHVGGEQRVMLGDFGIARALGHTGLTTTGSVMATLSYAAPEALTGHRVDHRADLYSLGCSLYRLLTGQSPFSGDGGAASVIAAHLHQAPPTVSDRVLGMPQAMDTVIATAMAKNPEHRYSSAHDLAAAARDALYSSPAASGPPTSPAPIHRQPWTQAHTPALAPPPARRPRRRIALIGVAAALAIATAITATIVATRHNEQPSAAPLLSPTSEAETTTAKPPVIITTAGLDPLLLSLPEMVAIMGEDMHVESTVHAFDDDQSITNDADKPCIGAVDAVQHQVYANSGARGLVYQSLLSDKSPAIGGQGLVVFPNAQLAQRVITQQLAAWSACSGRTIASRNAAANEKDPRPENWAVGQASNVDNILSITSNWQEGTAGNGCQRAMTARANVVIDVLMCHLDVHSRGVEVVKAIVAKIPQ